VDDSTSRSSSDQDNEDANDGFEPAPTKSDPIPDHCVGTTDDVSLAPAQTGGFGGWRVFAAELRMAVCGRARWWYLACVGAIVATAVAPFDSLQPLLVPIALLLLLPLWSQLGARNRRYRTEELVFVSSNPVGLLAVSYLVGLLTGVVVIFPALVRFAFSGSWVAFAGVLVRTCVLPAAALAIAVWSGRPRVFEMAYLVAWYLGPMNGFFPLDYLGVHATTIAGTPAAYVGVTLLLLVVGLGGRYRRV